MGVVTQPDKPRGRGRRLSPSPVKAWAQDRGIPALTPELPRGPEFEATLRRLEPRVSVVVAYGHILLPRILDLPPDGSINLHASLLPELRGAGPVSWAILRGLEATGVTAMRMAEEMDAGPILLQKAVPIGLRETAAELTRRLSELGAQALVETLSLLDAGELVEEEQDHEKATFAPKVDRAMARVDWNRNAGELDLHLRGFDSIPGGWTTLEGETLKLFRPLPHPDAHSQAPPGTVLLADPSRGFTVACGRGTLVVEEVQPAGKRRMPATDWLRGRPLATGTLLR